MNKHLIFLLLCLPTLILYSQTTGNSGWISIATKKKLTKKIALKAELGFRESTINDKSRYFDVALKYKLNKLFKLSGAYRHGIDKENFEYFNNAHRFNIDLSSKHSIVKKLKFNYRLRLQKKYTNPFTSSKGYLPNNNIRNRFLFKYKQSKKLYFVFGTELFAKQNYKTNLYFNKSRGILGLEQRLNKKQNLGLSYIYQKELQVTSPINQHILSIEYSYNF